MSYPIWGILFHSLLLLSLFVCDLIHLPEYSSAEGDGNAL